MVDTYQLVLPTGSSIKVGDKVRVRPSVVTPTYKWGSVTHRSVGTVTAVISNGRDITVDFPQQAHWTGVIDEMELVPSTHTGVEYVKLIFLSFVFFLFFNEYPHKTYIYN